MPVLKSRRSGKDLRNVFGHFVAKPKVVKRKLNVEERIARLERRVDQLEHTTSPHYRAGRY